MRSPLADMSVLITGGAGFVGSHLAASLVEQTDVTILDDLSTGSRDRVPPGARLIVGDVRDQSLVRAAISDIDVVFHQAGIMSVEDSIRAPSVSHRVNATGTLHVLEAARDDEAAVIVASSAAVYGEQASTPIRETATLEPTSPYGLEKLTADQYARLYHRLYGLDTVALRYFNVYGPRREGGPGGVISNFFEQARRGDPITVEGDGSQTRDFVHIDDVVRANLLAATEPAAIGRAINIGSGSSISIHDLADRILEHTDSDSPITYDDPRPGDIMHSEADITIARERLTFEPLVDLEMGLDSMTKPHHLPGEGSDRSRSGGTET